MGQPQTVSAVACYSLHHLISIQLLQQVIRLKLNVHQETPEGKTSKFILHNISPKSVNEISCAFIFCLVTNEGQSCSNIQNHSQTKIKQESLCSGGVIRNKQFHCMQNQYKPPKYRMSHQPLFSIHQEMTNVIVIVRSVIKNKEYKWYTVLDICDGNTLTSILT